MIKRELTLKLLASEGGTKALGANFDKGRIPKDLSNFYKSVLASWAEYCDEEVVTPEQVAIKFFGIISISKWTTVQFSFPNWLRKAYSGLKIYITRQMKLTGKPFMLWASSLVTTYPGPVAVP